MNNQIKENNGTAPQLTRVLNDWLEQFDHALRIQDEERLAELLVDDAEWRDLVSLSWDIQTTLGAGPIAKTMLEQNQRAQAKDFHLVNNRIPARVVNRGNREVIEGFFEFSTRDGKGEGIIRISAQEQAPPKAQAILTSLRELDKFPEMVGKLRRESDVDRFGSTNWLDRRNQELNRDNYDVLIVGAGQAGLALAARLRHIGVDALVIDKGKRVGDNWRNRYHNLTLHNETWACHLPYMPFPDTWPRFIPKDKLAAWFEAYVEAMEINVWTGTEFLYAKRDEAENHWNVSLRQGDTVRDMQPRHVVMATGGVSGVPNIPDIAGLSDFTGKVIHSSKYGSGKEFAGKRVAIFGSGVSAHDIAQDLHSHGSEVTMIQRNSISVVGLDSGNLAFAAYRDEPWAVEDIDLIGAANAYPTIVRGHQLITRRQQELDKDLLDSLTAVGFKTDIGEDGTGANLKYNRRGGGYYINVGASELIAQGQVKLLQADLISHVNANGIELHDGSQVEADALILATGYKNQQEEVRKYFGDAVADKVGLIWGYGEDHELRNVYRRTSQPGLWFMAGSLLQSRVFSRYLALQIKAVDEGLCSPEPVESGIATQLA